MRKIKREESGADRGYRIFHNNTELIKYVRHTHGSTTKTLPSQRTISKKCLALFWKKTRSSSTEKTISNIFMAEIETDLLNQSRIKPSEWKRYTDDVFSLWDVNRTEIDFLIEQANKEDTVVYVSREDDPLLVVCRGDRFQKESILDIRTQYKPTETFQYTHFTSCRPAGVKRGFLKGEALRLLRTNFSETAFKARSHSLTSKRALKLEAIRST